MFNSKFILIKISCKINLNFSETTTPWSLELYKSDADNNQSRLINTLLQPFTSSMHSIPTSTRVVWVCGCYFRKLPSTFRNSTSSTTYNAPYLWAQWAHTHIIALKVAARKHWWKSLIEFWPRYHHRQRYVLDDGRTVPRRATRRVGSGNAYFMQHRRISSSCKLGSSAPDRRSSGR